MRQKFTLRCEYIHEDTGKREETNEASMEFPYEVGLMDSKGELLKYWFLDALSAMGYHRDNVENFFNYDQKEYYRGVLDGVHDSKLVEKAREILNAKS